MSKSAPQQAILREASGSQAHGAGRKSFVDLVCLLPAAFAQGQCALWQVFDAFDSSAGQAGGLGTIAPTGCLGTAELDLGVVFGRCVAQTPPWQDFGWAGKGNRQPPQSPSAVNRGQGRKHWDGSKGPDQDWGMEPIAMDIPEVSQLPQSPPLAAPCCSVSAHDPSTTWLRTLPTWSSSRNSSSRGQGTAYAVGAYAGAGERHGCLYSESAGKGLVQVSQEAFKGTIDLLDSPKGRAAEQSAEAAASMMQAAEAAKADRAGAEPPPQASG